METDKLLEMVHSLMTLTTLINLMCHLLPERILVIDLNSQALLQPLIEHLLIMIEKKNPQQLCTHAQKMEIYLNRGLSQGLERTLGWGMCVGGRGCGSHTGFLNVGPVLG